MESVTVIVPTLNSGPLLKRCLSSVGGQEGVYTEIVVVDQESHDETVDIARKAGANVVTLPRPPFYAPPARSRNVGARLARGQFLLHLDADMELPPGTLAACVAMCQEGDYVALTLHEVDRGAGFWTACKALERRCYWGIDAVEGARFVRADAFWAAGGYDEGLGSGEDWDVHRRYLAQGRVGESPAPLVHHLGRVTLTGQLKKKFAYGRSARPFLRKGSATGIGLGMSRAYWRSRRRLAEEPLHAAGFLVLRTAEALALALGIAVQEIGLARWRSFGQSRVGD
jgi:glycosyltransferase involved in cell wall biosynthesis